MARKIVVSSLGICPPPYSAEIGGLTHEEMADRMVAFWRSEIERVLPDRPDLVVLPEMCDRFFGTPPKTLLASRDLISSRVIEALQDVARENRCYVVYAGARPGEDGLHRNSALMIDRSGDLIGQYDKNHTVVSEIENGLRCGTETPIIECDFGTVGFVICFDLNFDELRVRYKALRPDLLIFPSMFHGGLMQSYWAYSCRAHFVGCVGVDNLPNEIYSPVGHRIACSTNYFAPVTAIVNLDCAVAHLDFNAEKMRALKSNYGRGVTIFDPGQLGSVLITSELDDVSVQEMIDEFGITLLDDYLARSLAHHHSLTG